MVERGGDSALVDALGTVHEPLANHTAARIVSLVPSITELLFALGLGDQVVGRTGFCIHPRPAVDQVPKVGGTKKVRLARLLELAPTHVIVNIDENTREMADEITAAGPALVVTHPIDPEDNLSLYNLLGGLFGCQEHASRLCGEFERARASLLANRSRFSARRVLYLIWRDPWMTVCADTYIARMLGTVGWSHYVCHSEDRYPQIDLGTISADDIDLVLLSSEPFPFKDRHIDEVTALLAQGGAVRRPVPVRLIDGEMVSWYGSRAIAGLSYLNDFALAMQD